MKLQFLRLVALLLAASLALSIIACADPTAMPDDGNDKLIEDDNPYPYDSVNFDGRSYDILNLPPNLWTMITEIVIDPSTTSDHLREAIYKRQLYVEGKLGITLSQSHSTGVYTELLPYTQQLVATGDTTYELVYQRSDDVASGVVQGLYLELSDIPQLQLEESYWNQEFLANASIAHKTYMAMSDLQLMGIEGTWVLYFNQDMMDDLSLEYPYQLVREQKWTLDRLFEYCAAGADLGTESSWGTTIKAGQTSVYGLLSMKTSALCEHLIYGCGASFVEKDRTSDLPYWAGETEMMNNAITKIANGTKVKGNYVGAGYNASDDNLYTAMFVQERCLFLGAELKDGHGDLQKMEDTFGVVPLPKYDEYQEDYRATMFTGVPAVTLLSITPDVAYSAFVVDALSYETERTVIDTYYDITLTQRSIRNEDSAQMVDQFILPNRGCDIALLYYWIEDLADDMCNRIMNGSGNQSSRIAKYAPTIQKEIELLISNIENAPEKKN